MAWAVKEARASPASYSASVVYVGEQRGGVTRGEFRGRVLPRRRTEFLTNFRTP